MRTHTRCWMAAALLAQAVSAQAAGTIELKWVEPEKFSDIGFGTIERDSTLSELAAHIQRLAARLPDGQALKLDVTDLDLAGERRFKATHELRVLRGRADWPRMELSYTLSADGRVIKQGQARISDMNYLFTQRSDSLGYEKRMIDDWFKATFVAPQP